MKPTGLNHDRSVTGLPGFQVLLRVDETTVRPGARIFQDPRVLASRWVGPSHRLDQSNRNRRTLFSTLNLDTIYRSLNTPFARQHILEANQVDRQQTGDRGQAQ